MSDSPPEVTDGARTDAKGAPGAPADPLTVLRSRRYLGLLVVSAILGAPIAFVAYWFLKLVALLQTWAFQDVPHGLGLGTGASWWPVVPLAVAGLVVGLTIRY